MQRPVRPLPLWPWLGLLAISLGLSGAILWTVWSRSFRPVPGGSPRVMPQSAPLPVAGERRHLRLFFPQESGEVLKEEERDLPRRASLAEEVRAALRALSAGIGPGLRAPLPPGVEVRQVFLDGVGILYVDCSKEIQALATAPGLQSALALAAIVTSLTTSFSEIKRVQFLSEGQELTALAGGVDLRRPIAPSFPGEEAPATPPRPEESRLHE